MTNVEFTEAVYDRYVVDGQEEAIQYAIKSGRCNWEYCEACESETPVLKHEHECLICGQWTKPINDD